MESLPECEKSATSCDSVKVLGLLWNQNDDTFSIPGSIQMTKLDVATKHDVLHSVSKIFDPLGLFSPVTLYGKVFLQKLWALNITWDEPLSTTLLMEWNQIVQQLSEISEFRIPRLVGDAQGTDYQLLIFCDASVKAYAAVVYLRFKDGTNFQTNLLFAKMRLVPVGRKSSLKHLTIPRLELLAMLIDVRVANFIVKELRIKYLKGYYGQIHNVYYTG